MFLIAHAGPSYPCWPVRRKETTPSARWRGRRPSGRTRGPVGVRLHRRRLAQNGPSGRHGTTSRPVHTTGPHKHRARPLRPDQPSGQPASLSDANVRAGIVVKGQVWTSVRGAGVTSVSPAERGPSGARPSRPSPTSRGPTAQHARRADARGETTLCHRRVQRPSFSRVPWSTLGTSAAHPFCWTFVLVAPGEPGYNGTLELCLLLRHPEPRPPACPTSNRRFVLAQRPACRCPVPAPDLQLPAAVWPICKTLGRTGVDSTRLRHQIAADGARPLCTTATIAFDPARSLDDCMQALPCLALPCLAFHPTGSSCGTNQMTGD